MLLITSSCDCLYCNSVHNEAVEQTLTVLYEPESVLPLIATSCVPLSVHPGVLQASQTMQL